MKLPLNNKRADKASNDSKGLTHLPDREFRRLRDFILEASGIHLTDQKKSLLANRLAFRLHQLGLQSFGEYYDFLLKDNDGEELSHLIDRVTTNETAFFRERKQFELLERVTIPEWKRQASENLRKKILHIWSAGCATGEEPYSVAMLLLKHFPPNSGWKLKILASDISLGAIEKAKEGVWALNRAKEIPDELVKQFMLKGTGNQQENMKAGRELRSVICFKRHNLIDSNYPVDTIFDLILCRNVLIYFKQEQGLRVVHNLLDCLDSKGLLLLGHSESLIGRTERVTRVIPTVYKFADQKPNPMTARVKSPRDKIC